MDNVKVFELVTVIRDAYPLFVVSIDDVFKDILTFSEMALNDDYLNCTISKMRVKSLQGKPTYILNLRR